MHNDDFVADLHPPGSANNIQIEVQERILIRPEIHFVRAGLITLSVILADVLIGIAVSFFLDDTMVWNISSGKFGLLCSIAALLLFLFFVRKKILIWFIHIYQRYASDNVRQQCVFFPSCSEYMIMSIKEYGVIIGIIKGIKRIKRCHAPNGGEDYPFKLF